MLNVCSRIVVPFDNSERSKKALNTAMTLAKQDEKIELSVITVLDKLRFPNVNSNMIAIEDGYITAAKEALSAVEENLKTIPNKTSTVILEGNAGVTIVDFIKDNHVDLVIMGSRGLSDIEELFLGSVSHYVVQKSPSPVLIIK